MIRICVIGNSHLAALKLAWDKINNQFADIQITFFGAPGSFFQEITLAGGILLPQSDRLKESMLMTSGGYDKIILDNYDIFVLHALGFSFDKLVANIDNNINFNKIKRFLNRTLAYQLALKIKTFNKPILLSPQPFFSEKVIHSSREKYEPWHQLLDEQGMPKSNLTKLLNLWQQAQLHYGFLAQPPDTIINGVFTKAIYSKDSIRITDMVTKHPPNDYSHMNPAYGELVIKNMINRCREMLQNNQITASKDSKPIVAQITHPNSDKNHPYINLPDRAFWRRTVSKPALEITNWYQKKFPIRNLAIATAGSCFAQHIGRRLRQHNFSYVDTELPPINLAPDSYLANGYGMYSARYGNIYTSRQLLQLIKRATGDFIPQETYWETTGGYVDPFRPTIQEQPFITIEELIAAREQHLAAVRTLFQQAQVFIFTLGLTETWVSIKDGAVFPVAPGVSGGRFNSDQYRFLNLGFDEVLKDLQEFIDRTRQINTSMKFIFTVSPVPLIATASNQQIVVATTYSKSVLRAVAGQLATNRKYIDYFPSFEIVNSHIMHGQFYEDDLRSVSEMGVDHVMKIFFAEHTPPVIKQSQSQNQELDSEDDSIICDEELLAAFGSKKHD